MKLPPFDLVRPDSFDEVVAALTEHGADAAVLAGGQSLLLELRYGDRAAGVLVGLDRVAGADRLAVDHGRVDLGPLVSHATVGGLGDHPGAGTLGRLCAGVAPAIAHPPIRSRGTFVGSLAWGHPCAEWNALARLVDATVQVAGPSGVREVAAADWFVGDRRTVRAPEEVVVGASLPALPDDAGVGFVEHRRTHASFALVAALAAVTLAGDGTVAEARVALAGGAAVPVRSAAAEATLVGAPPTDASVAEAARLLGEACDPVEEPHCSPDYRRHAAEVVARRALSAALEDARRRTSGAGVAA